MISYREQRPSPALVEYLECFWFASDSRNLSANKSEKILPDNCVEWIFHLGEPFERWTPGKKWKTQPRSFIVGELTRYLLVRSTGQSIIMGVRFRPGAAYRFLPTPLDELTDQNIPTGDLWSREGKRLEEAINEAEDDVERQRIVEEFLLRRLSTTTSRPRFEFAVKEIIRHRGQMRVGEVASEIGLSSRQLEREFRLNAGLAPKAFARIIRFQNLLRLVGERSLREWTALALEGGYADQPHMVREFRDFAGQSPSERDLIIAGDLGSCFVSPQRLAVLLGV